MIKKALFKTLFCAAALTSFPTLVYVGNLPTIQCGTAEILHLVAQVIQMTNHVPAEINYSFSDIKDIDLSKKEVNLNCQASLKLISNQDNRVHDELQISYRAMYSEQNGFTVEFQPMR